MPRATLRYLLTHPLDYFRYRRAKRQGLSVFVTRSGEVFWTEKAHPKKTISFACDDLDRVHRRFQSLEHRQNQ